MLLFSNISHNLGLLILSWLALLSPLAQCQVSIVNGQAMHSGTPVQQNPYGIPTLIYNCAKVPALCENVNKQYPLDAYTHSTTSTVGTATVVAAAATGYSTLQGRTHLLLHFDRAAQSKNRRGVACGTGWKKVHGCPEVDQPEYVPLWCICNRRASLTTYIAPFLQVLC